MRWSGIILPPFNRAPFLPKRLPQSTRRLHDWECVVVTMEVPTTPRDRSRMDVNLSRSRQYVTGKKGAYGARNTGLDTRVPGRFVAFFDSDDLWLPIISSAVSRRWNLS